MVKTFKIGPVDPEITLLKGLFKEKKKLTQAEHIARRACMPCGLNRKTLVDTTF